MRLYKGNKNRDVLVDEEREEFNDSEKKKKDIERKKKEKE